MSVSITKHQAMKKYWGSGGRSPRILNLDIWMEVSNDFNKISFTDRKFPSLTKYATSSEK